MKSKFLVKKASSILLSLAILLSVLALSGAKINASSEFSSVINSNLSNSKFSCSSPFAASDAAYTSELEIAKSGDAKSGTDGSSDGIISTNENANSTEQSIDVSGSADLNRYLLKFQSGYSDQEIYNRIKGYAYEVIGESSKRTFLIQSKSDLSAIKTALGSFCEYIEKDSVLTEGAGITLSSQSGKSGNISNLSNVSSASNMSEMTVTPNDPYYNLQWYLTSMNVTPVWDTTTGSDSTFVAVIDSGVKRSQKDFVNTDIRSGIDVVRGGAVSVDASGHGTMVVGIIAASMNNSEGITGISPKVAIVPYCIESDAGTILASDLASAIYSAADLPCKVINISLGGGFSSVVKDAVSYAIGKGCIVVSSAGNDGNETLNYPASYDGVISVGSVNQSLNKSYFSNSNSMLDVVAPGENICTTEDFAYTGRDYGYHDGTSFSSPCISGIAALAVSIDPTLSVLEFTNLLESTCTDLGSAGYDTSYGYGIVNAQKLMEAVVTRPVVNYQSHVQDIGWQDTVSDGAVSGTSGQSKRLEAMHISLQNVSGGIEYRTHVQDIGWMNWVSDGALSGTSGQSKRLEAIQIRLTGAAADQYDVYYRVHAQNYGWLDWAQNGDPSGTAAQSLRLEAIQIVLVPKGGTAPGATARPFVQG